MKQQQSRRIRIFGTSAALLLVLSSFVAGCGKPKSHLRVDGTIDVGDGVKVEFVLIEPGSFRMGSDDPDPREYIDEKPAHEVTLTKPFYLGKFEVTQEQWLKVMKKNPSEFEGPDLPVENVSWDDVQTFLKRMRKMTGENFILPSEAQWEYACRADITTRYSCGNSDTELQDYAWFYDNSGRSTHPVGEKKPNKWGLYDMSGNVWEWCADSYGRYPEGDATDPLISRPSGLHVVRGGSYTSKAGGMRPGNRNSEWRGTRAFGFRCAIPAN